MLGKDTQGRKLPGPGTGEEATQRIGQPTFCKGEQWGRATARGLRTRTVAGQNCALEGETTDAAVRASSPPGPPSVL